MRGDRFFSAKDCFRCGKPLVSRILSWFNSDVICMDCSGHEKEIRAKLPNHGVAYEGCGYIPAVKSCLKS